MIIKNLGHSCFLCVSDNGSFVFDPYSDNSVPGLTCPNIKCDKLLISHDHHDHNAKDKVNGLKENNKIIIEKFNTFHDNENGNIRGNNLIHKVSIDGITVSHLGDLGQEINDEIINFLLGSDIVLCPINGFYTIGYKTAIEIFNKVKPHIFIPMHYFKNNTGYPDNGQIEMFKKECGNFISIHEQQFDSKDYLAKEKKILIFERS